MNLGLPKPIFNTYIYIRHLRPHDRPTQLLAPVGLIAQPV